MAAASEEATDMDKAIEDAATAVDETAGVTAGDEATTNKEEPKSVKGMMKGFRKHSDGTNVMKEYIKTFSSSEGSDKKEDLTVQDKEECLTRLKELVDVDKRINAKKPKKIVKWEFRSSPHEQFGKTLDDTFSAFVLWAKSSSTDGSYNVSKAFRRLQSYAEWMEDTDQDLVEPLTADSVKAALDAWAMKCSVDKDGNFCWWVDYGMIDTKAIKSTLSHTDSIRAFVWYAHYVMYDTNAQENGVIFIENVNKIGFIQAMTLMPLKLSVKLDRLTIGVLPVKMNALYILECPTWIDLFMKFVAMFMSKKMKERLIILKDWNKVEEIVGKEAIPKPFGKLEGFIEVDPVDAKYFSC
jgi:hypothetical protein